MKVLFDSSGNPYPGAYIKQCVSAFGEGYSEAVQIIIRRSKDGIDKGIFLKSSAKLMSSFKMTRSGPFKGVGRPGANLDNDRRVLSASWEAIAESVLELKEFLISRPNPTRSRVLVEILEIERSQVAEKLWGMFKRLLPLCMSKTSLGLVGASKLLLSVLPEVALPVDNIQYFQAVEWLCAQIVTGIKPVQFFCFQIRQITKWGFSVI